MLRAWRCQLRVDCEGVQRHRWEAACAVVTHKSSLVQALLPLLAFPLVLGPLRGPLLHIPLHAPELRREGRGPVSR